MNYRRRQIEVSIDVSEIIEDIPDQELLEEIKARNLPGAHSTYCPLSVPPTGDANAIYRGWVEELRAAAKSCDWTHFEVLLLRMAPVPAREKASAGLAK